MPNAEFIRPTYCLVPVKCVNKRTAFLCGQCAANPINPLVLDEALAEASGVGLDVRELSQVEGVRLGAARQHLDGVIIYETHQDTSEETNALALGDLTLIGAFVLPSSALKVEPMRQRS